LRETDGGGEEQEGKEGSEPFHRIHQKGPVDGMGRV
jgi:hypothetical protein